MSKNRTVMTLKFCLSVLVGGAMGAANLWVWVRVVNILIANAAGQVVDVGAAVLQGFLKICALFGIIGVAYYLDVDLMGLALGFGVTLIAAAGVLIRRKV